MIRPLTLYYTTDLTFDLVLQMVKLRRFLTTVDTWLVTLTQTHADLLTVVV